SFKVEAQRKLTLYDNAGLLRMEFSKVVDETSIDGENGAAIDQYQCDSLGAVTLAEHTAETVKLMVGHSSDVLQRSPTASGVQYANAEMSFWQKGQQAMFTHYGQQHSCTRINA
ncbi:MAG: MliC family protein, partial [Lentilitoribacter sp.]